MASLRASLEMFDEAGIENLRAKSMKLTGYLRYLIEQADAGGFKIITPPQPEEQGCQLSLLVLENPQERYNALTEAGAMCDFREPDIIRIAPAPLYNTFHEVWRFAEVLTR